MDSLTQIVLGAAAGEAAFGKKVGNRAMLWGAVGGTIPDLDVMANFFTNEMSALAMHRGISHSIFFAVVTPIFFAYLVHQLYESGLYKSKFYKGVVSVIILGFISLVFFGVPMMAKGEITTQALLIGISVLGLAGFFLWKKYLSAELEEVDSSLSGWTWLFFWAIFTHPLLDSLTAFGTQLFLPFSDYRVALNIISVVDPLYTIPFCIFLISASFLYRTNKWRRTLNYSGIVWSCMYLLYCTNHKLKVDKIFEKALVEQNIDFNRYRTSPTIFNNILWSGTAETDSAFYFGFYSLKDKEPTVKFKLIQKDHKLLSEYKDDRSYKILKWFSDDYYNVIRREDNKLQYNDMRYGLFGDGDPLNENDYIFKFIITEKDGELDAREDRGVKDRDIGKMIGEIWTRMNGV